MSDVPPGYKQTEVGVIPEDWGLERLGDILQSGTLGGNYPNSTIESSYPLIKMGNMGRGNIKLDRIEYILSSARPLPVHTLKYGDVLLNTRNTPDLVGKVAIWRGEMPRAYYNSNIINLSFKRKYVSSNEYANYYLNKRETLESIRGLAIGTTSVAAIYSRDLAKLPFVLPPLSEQRAIASALADVDALLASLEELLTKKRQLKQAAMQELLTGKTRLEGFEGEWEEVRLGEVSQITTGRKDVNEGSRNGVYPFFTCSKNHTYSNSYSFDTEAILIAGNGDVGNLHFYNGKFEAYQRTYVVHSFINSVLYIWHQLNYQLADKLGLRKIGSSIPYIKMENLRDFVYKRPTSQEEQQSIAAILSDMDTEIDVLEQRLTKTHDLKQGMMQELLTGRTRLV